MLAKMTSKNRLTLPKSIQRGGIVRAKLAKLELAEQDIVDAVKWARQAPAIRKSREK